MFYLFIHDRQGETLILVDVTKPLFNQLYNVDISLADILTLRETVFYCMVVWFMSTLPIRILRPLKL